MSRPRLLDLFAGAGGSAVGYHRAGFEVVGVDIAPQPHYPFGFVQGDALDVANWAWPWPGGLEGFDAIHASPPCQGYHSLGHDQPQLIAETRELLMKTGLPYVIENIPGARWALRDPVLICGTMFDPPLDGLKRHRLFEASWPLVPPAWPCRHKLAAPRFRVYEHKHWYLSPFVKVYGCGGGKANEHWQTAMEIDWMTDSELVEAIPPPFHRTDRRSTPPAHPERACSVTTIGTSQPGNANVPKTFTFPGEPVPKGRPRSNRSGHTYTPARTKQAEEAIRYELMAQGAKPTSEPVAVVLHFACKSQTADLDNLVKLCLDACQGFLWRNDRQVYRIVAEVERGAAEPQTQLLVIEQTLRRAAA